LIQRSKKKLAPASKEAVLAFSAAAAGQKTNEATFKEPAPASKLIQRFHKCTKIALFDPKIKKKLASASKEATPAGKKHAI
jgi:hypothetical protein